MADTDWRPIAEADNGIAYHIQLSDISDLVIGNSYPVWARDEDGRIYEALWSDDGKTAYWWDIEGESPVDPVEFMPHPLDPRFTTPTVSDMRDAEGHKRGVEAAVKVARETFAVPYCEDDARKHIATILAIYLEASGAVLCDAQPVGWVHEDVDKEMSCYDQGSIFPNDRSGGGFKFKPLYASSPSTSQTSEA